MRSILKSKYIYILITLFVMGSLIFILTFSDKHPDFARIVFFDVGQGDAIFIETPSAKQILIDMGPNRSVMRSLSKELGFFDRHIDLAIATHPDADHIGGLPEVLERISIGALIDSGITSDTGLFNEVKSFIDAGVVQKIIPRAGMVIDFNDGATLEILHPSIIIPDIAPNQGSIISLFRFGQTEVILTGDAPVGVEEYLVSQNKIMDVDVLKAGHHGSNTSSSAVFLQTSRPEFVIISASRDNRFGHPHQDVLSRLEQIGSRVIQTAEWGDIEILISKNGYTIK